MGDATPRENEPHLEQPKLHVEKELTPKITENVKGHGEPPEKSERDSSQVERDANDEERVEKEEKLELPEKMEVKEKVEIPLLEIKADNGHDNEDNESILSSRSFSSKISTSSCAKRASSGTLSRHVNRQQSDILPSLRELPTGEDASNMIFSHKGLPSNARYSRRRASDSTVLPRDGGGRKKSAVELTPKISQVTPKMSQATPGRAIDAASVVSACDSLSRNVLTGNGVVSQDEFKCRTPRKRDGNPLLGVGYDEPATARSASRVPPGGYSNGLW